MEVPGEGRRLECNQRHLFVTIRTDPLCLSLEQGHYSQPATHGSAAGSAEGACFISILHVPLAKFAVSLRTLLIARFYIPGLLREMNATVSDLTGSLHSAMHLSSN